MTQENESRVETVLVTGASAGIGLELARAFAVEGFDLVLVARSGDTMASVASRVMAPDRFVDICHMTPPGIQDLAKAFLPEVEQAISERVAARAAPRGDLLWK